MRRPGELGALVALLAIHGLVALGMLAWVASESVEGRPRRAWRRVQDRLIYMAVAIVVLAAAIGSVTA